MTTDQPDADRPRPVYDPTVLRGLAHPVRSRILDEMHATGPVRAADIARDLAIPANQASFHLRQLAKYGLVQEADGQGRDRRDRVWELTSEAGYSISVRGLREQPGGPAAVEQWRRQTAAWAHTVVDAAYALTADETVTVSISNHSLRLTRDEARELVDDLEEVLTQWGRRTRGRDADRRTYLLLQMLQPYPDTAPEPTRGGSVQDDPGKDDGGARGAGTP